MRDQVEDGKYGHKTHIDLAYNGLSPLLGKAVVEIGIFVCQAEDAKAVDDMDSRGLFGVVLCKLGRYDVKLVV